MLPLTNLDDQNYDEILEDYMHFIRAVYPEWTDFYDSDPGVTMFQLFAWLKEMQQYYINRIKADVRHKYLQLMETDVMPALPSRGAVIVDDASCGLDLPPGTGFLAGNIQFVTEREFYICCNKITKVYNPSDLACDVGNLLNYFICFEKPFKPDRNIFMRFEFAGNHPVKRNPIKDSAAFIPLQSVEWEFYTPEGFESLDAADGTLGFIQNGEIVFSFGSVQALHPDYGYCLKARIYRNKCDVIPEIDNVYLNYFPVVRLDSPVGECTEQGNINAMKVNKIYDMNLILQQNVANTEIDPESAESFKCNVYNPVPVEGGCAPETLEQAFARARKDLREISKAVTPSDFEGIIKATPGLMIEYVKAVCANNIAKIYVKPYQNSGAVGLSPAYISNMTAHLEKYRLITTRVEFYPFRKVFIDVLAELRVVEGEPLPDIRSLAEEYFTVKRKQPNGILEYYEIHRSIGAFKSIFLIKKLELSCTDTWTEKLNYGDIRLPVDALPYLGMLTVRFL